MDYEKVALMAEKWVCYLETQLADLMVVRRDKMWVEPKVVRSVVVSVVLSVAN